MTLKTTTLPDGHRFDYHFADFERRHVVDRAGRLCVQETTTFYRALSVGRHDPATGRFVVTAF